MNSQAEYSASEPENAVNVGEVGNSLMVLVAILAVNSWLLKAGGENRLDDRLVLTRGRVELHLNPFVTAYVSPVLSNPYLPNRVFSRASLNFEGGGLYFSLHP